MALPLLAIAAIGIGVTSIGADLLHTSSNVQKTKRKRPGPEDYEPVPLRIGASQGMTPLNPLEPLKVINNATLQPLYPTKPLQPLRPLQPLGLNSYAPRRMIYKTPEFNELTDPLQVNSLGDVLFNQEGRNIVMEDLGLDWVDNVPILGSIAETAIVGVDMLWQKYAKPISQGDFGKAFITGLNGLGEDLDTIDLANTVKGFVLEKDKSKAFNRSLGFGTEGKYNYNYDTGNGWKDFGLEVVSSPGTWITLIKGAVTQGVKGMAKTAIKETAERVARDTGVDATSEAMQSFIKRASRVAADSTLSTTKANELVQELMTDYVSKSLNKNSVNFSRQFMSEFNKEMTNILGSKTMTALKLIKPVDEVNDTLSGLALKTYLTGGTYPILYKTYDPIISRLKNVTLNGLTKITKKGIDVFKNVMPTDATVFDLVQVVDNATIKEITESQFKTVKHGRLKYGDALDFLSVFGSATDFDKRLTGMVRGIKDVENPEELFEAVLKMLEKDNKIDINILRNSAEFKDFIIGTAEGSGYVMKTASSLNAVEDALNKNFKYIRRDILNELSGAKTNLDAFVKLDNYFQTQGLTLKEMLERLDVMIKDPDVDTAMYLAQKEFLENLMDELGINREMLAKDSAVIERAVHAAVGENADEVLDNVLKETQLYKTRGTEFVREAESLFSLQKGFYKVINTDGKYADTFYKMLGDTTITGPERSALEQVIKAIEGDSPMNALLQIQDVLTGTPLEGTFLYANLNKMIEEIQFHVDRAIGVLEILEPKYKTPVSEYAKNPFADIEFDDYTPDGVYKRLKDLNFKLKALGVEDLETATYLQKLVDQPNIMKSFDNPIKPNELGKKLDLISFKNSDNFLKALKEQGVVKNVIENIPEEKLQEILLKINTPNAQGLNLFEEIREDLLRIISSDDMVDAGFLDEGISSMRDINEKMITLSAVYDRVTYNGNNMIIDSSQLVEFMDSIEDLTNSIGDALNARDMKEYAGELFTSKDIYRELYSFQSKIQEAYAPLFEYVMLSSEQGKAYRFKLLQFFNRIENINKLRDTVYQGQSTLDILIDIAEGRQTVIGGLIESIATGNTTEAISDNFKTMAQQIQKKAQSTVNYLKLQEAIYDLSPSHNLDDALMDWLENFNRKAPGEAVVSKLELEEALASRTDLGRATNKMKLENYYEENVKHLYDDTLRAHNATDDRIMQVRVLQHQYDKGLINLSEGQRFVSFDLETTGLSLKQAEFGDSDILQISAARYELRNGRIIQTDDGFEMFGKPRRKVVKEVQELVGPEVMDRAIKEGLSTQEVISAFKEYVGDYALAGHNIAEFDLPYLKAVSNYDNPRVIDTLQIMRDTEFKKSVYSNENIEKFKKYVEDSYKIITEYAAKQSEIGMPFIYTIDKHLADDLYDLFNPLDSQLRTMDKQGLNALSHGRIEDARSYILGKADSSVDYSHTNLPEGTDAFDATRDGTSMIQTLRQGLIDTKNQNAELANWYITTDALEKAYGTTNIFAVMHGMREGRYVDDFILNKFGIKTVWSPKHINILNNIPENINVVGAVQLDKFRGALDRNYERIFNNISGYTAEHVAQMRTYILEDFAQSVYLKYTNLEELSMYELWALYQTLSQYNIVKGVRVEVPNYNAARALMSNGAVSESIRNSIMFVDDVAKLNASYDILADPLSSNKAIDDALADILANGSDSDTLRAIDIMEREYTTFVKESGTFDEEWYAKTIRSEFETNYTVLRDARNLVHSKRNIKPEVFYQYQRLNKQRFVNHTKSLLGLEPASLTKYMHEHGFVSYLKGSDLTTFNDDIQHILSNKKLYEEAGISFKQTDDMFVMYLNKNYEALYPSMAESTVYKMSYRGAPDKTQLDESMLAFMDAFEKNDIRIKELADSPFDAYNSSYNKIDGAAHAKMIDELDLKDIVSEAYKSDFYGRVYQIDAPIIGTVEGIKRVHPYATTDIVNAQVKELDRTLKLSGARQKYIQFLFNDDYTLKRNALWDAMSDEQILDTLKGNKNLSVVVLHEKNGKVMARKISPTTIEHIQSIRNLNGSIFPADMANKITGTINEYDKILKENHPILAKWREYVVSTYKTLYLTSLGFLFRNGLDIVTKNTATMGGGPLTIPSTIKYNMKAFKMWSDYSRVIGDILSGPDARLTSDIIDAYFRTHPELSREVFEFVHRYATSAGSAGMAQAQQELVKNFNMSKHSVQTNLYKKVLYENALVKNLMSANGYIEHSGRLGLLLQSIEEGKVFDDAIQDVVRTHFDYSNLSYAELIAESFIPFITFPIRNLDYWAGAIKGNMWMVELMADATMETNQLHSQSQFMIDNSNSLQNDIANGNLRVLSSVVKTSPSAFDAARLLLTPADAIANYSDSDLNRRIIAPLRMPRDKDAYGNENDNVTKTNEYLRNVLAIYQVERPLTVASNILGINDGHVDNPADVAPSIFGERIRKPGNMTGDMRMYQRLPSGHTLQTIVQAGFRQDANAERVTTQVTAPKKPTSRASYSKQRIPYAKRYYSNSYNFHNRWKAQSYMRKNAMRNLPPTP
ncbi:MAG: hypothetical protein EOL95_10285, partial [Bacteroidia bacterium]|nr:hypothetical protein [Bacteroidia bacterium]